MNRYITFTVLVLAASAAAQQPANLTLDECLHRAGTFAPVVRAGSVAVEKARIMQGTAFDPDMTEVSLTQETTTGDSPDNGVKPAKNVPDYCLNITPQEELDKLNVPRETIFVFRDRGTGRPTKKERRDLDSLMDGIYYDDEE